MVFIGAGKAHTDHPGHQQKRKTPKSINIKRESYRDGKNKIFGHMRRLAHQMFNLIRIGFDLPVFQRLIEYPAADFNNFTAHLVAELARIHAGLG